MDYVQDFIDFLYRSGIGPANAGEIIADDRRRRYSVAGEARGSKNGAYQLAVSGDVAFGWARSHAAGQTFKYFSGNRDGLSAEERARLKAQNEERRQARAAQREAEQADAATMARDMWKAAKVDYAQAHPYATRKGVDLAGVRVLDGEILVPLVDRLGQMWNLQRISKRGDKWFLGDAKVEGLYHPIGGFKPMLDLPLFICEGWATGKTIHKATGCPVACAMNAGGMLPAAINLRKKFKYTRFFFAEDFDAWTLRAEIRREKFKDLDVKAVPGDDSRWQEWRSRGWLYNTGAVKAAEAAAKSGGAVVPFPAQFITHAQKPTDYNDLQAVAGIEFVREWFRPWGGI